jgi:hypothetical protein
MGDWFELLRRLSGETGDVCDLGVGMVVDFGDLGCLASHSCLCWSLGACGGGVAFVLEKNGEGRKGERIMFPRIALSPFFSVLSLWGSSFKPF